MNKYHCYYHYSEQCVSTEETRHREVRGALSRAMGTTDTRRQIPEVLSRN